MPQAAGGKSTSVLWKTDMKREVMRADPLSTYSERWNAPTFPAFMLHRDIGAAIAFSILLPRSSPHYSFLTVTFHTVTFHLAALPFARPLHLV